jgi:hypothetical protein
LIYVFTYDVVAAKVDSFFYLKIFRITSVLGKPALDVDRGVVAERKTPSGERLGTDQTSLLFQSPRYEEFFRIEL